MARSHTVVAAVTMAMPTSRSQPECRLGIAAYWLTNAGGCSTR